MRDNNRPVFHISFSALSIFATRILILASRISYPASRIPDLASRIASLLLILLAMAIPALAADADSLPLAAAPDVPPPLQRVAPPRVKIELEATEFHGRLADGTEYDFWGYNGTVPGPFIRVREGETIELTLKNNAHNTFIHSIDLHAVTGPGGGAPVTQTPPGAQSTFTWKALHPGLFVYHCASPHVPTHIANGMYGLILVEPVGGHLRAEPSESGGLFGRFGERIERTGGLPKVDREFYIMQGEFYTQGAHGARGLQSFSIEKARQEQPDYVVFNGREGSLTGEHALKANVGEKIRLFIGNGGPNLTSAFHIIGETFDQVYLEGAIGAPVKKDVQTVPIPPGSAAIVELTLDVPGTYLLVDHSIFRAFDKGALGMLEVSGPEAPDLFMPGVMR